MSHNKQQIKIGVTGGIGSGKTFVGKVFNKLGVPVFNSDVVSKKCMKEDESLKQKIQHLFGNNIYKNGLLQTKILADIVFHDNQKLKDLNALVHPLVQKKFQDWCVNHTEKIVIKEAAILFESNSHLALDKVICVSADEEIRIRRVMKRDSISEEKVVARMSVQILQNEKEKLSDFVIVNDGARLLLPQIIKILNQIS